MLLKKSFIFSLALLSLSNTQRLKAQDESEVLKDKKEQSVFTLNSIGQCMSQVLKQTVKEFSAGRANFFISSKDTISMQLFYNQIDETIPMIYHIQVMTEDGEVAPKEGAQWVFSMPEVTLKEKEALLAQANKDHLFDQDENDDDDEDDTSDETQEDLVPQMEVPVSPTASEDIKSEDEQVEAAKGTVAGQESEEKEEAQKTEEGDQGLASLLFPSGATEDWDSEDGQEQLVTLSMLYPDITQIMDRPLKRLLGATQFEIENEPDNFYQQAKSSPIDSSKLKVFISKKDGSGEKFDVTSCFLPPAQQEKNP